MASPVQPKPASPARALSSAQNDVTPVRKNMLDAARESVYVAVRIRPLLPSEVTAGDRAAWTATGEDVLTCLPDEKSSGTFDRVFPEASSSEAVYQEAAKRLVGSAMQGYNCTIFAYGQTGAGKTTTMRAIVQHSARDIFSHIVGSKGREYLLKMSAIEIYNEEVHDLLNEAATNLKVLDDLDRNPVVDGLTGEPVKSEKHLEQLIKLVDSRRYERETKMNQNSSRSHLIVRLYVESRPASKATGDAIEEGDGEDDASGAGSSNGNDLEDVRALAPVTVSTINFVDLAGSERLSQVASDDAEKEKLRQKEAGNINKSLLTLGEVIRALGAGGGGGIAAVAVGASVADKRLISFGGSSVGGGRQNERDERVLDTGRAEGGVRRHIPYRNSKLTRILQPALSGNSKMAIICTISPAMGSIENTKAALHFARTARKIEMRPKVNEVNDEKAIIKAMEAEIFKLRHQLAVQAQVEQQEKGHLMVQQVAAEKDKLLAEREAALKEKEEQVRMTGEEKQRLEKKLRHMEKFIIKGGSPLVKGRRSFDGLESLAGPPRMSALLGGGGNGGTAVGVRASWNPSSTSPSLNGGDAVMPSAPLAMSRASMMPRKMLLDYMLPPGTRRVAGRMIESMAESPFIAPFSGRSPLTSNSGAAGGNNTTPPGAERVNGSRLTAVRSRSVAVGAMGNAAHMLELQVPKGPKADEALAALQAEVRLMSLAAPKGLLAAASGPASSANGHGVANKVGDGDEGSGGDGHDESGREGSGRKPAAVLSALVRQLARLEADTSDANDVVKQELVSLLRKRIAELQAHAAAEAQGSRAIQSLRDRVQEAKGDGAEGCDTAASSGRVADQERGALGSGDQGAVPQLVGRLQSALLETLDSHGRTLSYVEEGTEACSHPLAQQGSDAAAGAARQGSGTAAGASYAQQRQQQQTPGAAGATPNSKMVTKAPLHGFHRESDVFVLMGSPQVSMEVAPMPSNGSMATPSLPSISNSDGEVAGGSVSSRPGHGKPWDTDRVKKVLKNQEHTIRAWYYTELARLKAEFREGADKDLQALQESLASYKDQLERLDMQKKLLMAQVLQLEVALDEAARLQGEAQQTIAKLTSERDEARFETSQLAAQSKKAWHKVQEAEQRAAAAALHSPATPNMPGAGNGLIEESGSLNRWNEPPTPDVLFPDIFQLWEDLCVPLVYRSRFYQQFCSSETIFVEMELRRLQWRNSRAREDKLNTGHSRDMDKAVKALERERKVLAEGLRLAFSEVEREQLYEMWGVHPGSKSRKLQLLRRLWQPASLKGPGNVESTAQLVIRLAGPDASSEFMQLVFGNTAEVGATPSAVGAMFSVLRQRVVAATPRGSASRSSMGSPGASGLPSTNNTPRPAPGGVTPRRHSTAGPGILANLTTRLSSFVSRGSIRRSESQHVAASSGLPLPGTATQTPRGPTPPLPHQGVKYNPHTGAPLPHISPLPLSQLHAHGSSGTVATPQSSSRGPGLPPHPPAPATSTATLTAGNTRGGRPTQW